MSQSAVQIVATGARTPIGLASAPTAAAVRAGISRLGEHPFMIDRLGDPMVCAIDPELDPEIWGAERFVQLLLPALREACAPLEDARAAMRELPCFLALPELRPGFEQADVDRVRDGVVRGVSDWPVRPTKVETFPHGHAAGFRAFAAAQQTLASHGLGCLVAGVESYLHPDTMEWLDENRQLAGADARSAFVPGEGAGACLLMSGPDVARRGLPPSPAGLLSVGLAEESALIKTQDVCLGRGLAAAIEAALTCLSGSDARIGDIVCDLNSERYRSEEWGFASLALASTSVGQAPFRTPARSWGDVGAASATLFAGLVCQAAARGYAAPGPALLWSSSEGGLRGAAVLAPDSTRPLRHLINRTEA